jgi:uncharacterized membrane protein
MTAAAELPAEFLEAVRQESIQFHEDNSHSLLFRYGGWVVLFGFAQIVLGFAVALQAAVTFHEAMFFGGLALIPLGLFTVVLGWVRDDNITTREAVVKAALLTIAFFALFTLVAVTLFRILPIQG